MVIREVIVALVVVEVAAGRGLDLRACDDKIFHCNCGSSGYQLHFPIKQCTFFYRWKPSCKPCDDIQESSYCSKYANCQECSKNVDRCVRCPDNRYGQWCAGVCQCQNGAICQQDNGGCQCLAGFSGRYCEIKDNPTCGRPETPVNGGAKWTSTNVGDTVTYYCDPGYVLVGTPARTCTNEVKWSQNTPQCENVCPSLQFAEPLVVDIIPHGHSGNQYAKAMHFKCKDGYHLLGNRIMNCLSSGAWDGESPKCVKSCSTLQVPLNGHVTYTDQALRAGTIARIGCKETFMPAETGIKEIICLENATWSHLPPKCEKITYCMDLGMQPFVNVKSIPGPGGELSEGTRLMYSCPERSILIGPDVVECQTNGQWSADPPICIFVSDKVVTCASTGAEFLLDTKAQLRIKCPGGCGIGNTNIWGTGIYKKESEVCAAAIHAGMISSDGGSVYIINNGNYTQFSLSTSNGITSKRSRGTAASFRFTFVDEPEDARCPLGWTEVQGKCLIYVEKAAARAEAINMCHNLAASMATVHGGQTPEIQRHIPEHQNVNDSRRIWIDKMDSKEESDLFLDIDVRSALSKSPPNASSTWIIPTESPEVPDVKCTALDNKEGIVKENCDHRLSFMCQTNRTEIIVTDEDCANPGSIENGIIIPSGTIDGMFVVNSTIEFSCTALHYIEGSRVIRCLANNTWSAELPRCVKVPTCPEPTPIKNGIYNILPALTSRSAARASLAVSQPTTGQIMPRTVPRPLSIPAFSRQTLPNDGDKVTVPAGRHRVGARVQFSCESQFYNLVGSSTRTCMADGQWSGRQSTCQPVCGISSSPRAPFIVNGQPTKIGQWPWQIGLARREFLETETQDGDNSHWFLFCGGSLLTESWVVTAAHCVTHQGTNTIIEMGEMRLYFGKYYRNDTLDDEWVQTRTIEEIHVYPDFNPVLFDGDLALIRLDEPVKLTSRVTPVCLPNKQSGISERHLQAGTMGVVTGWGTDETNQYSSTLLQADVPVVSSAECEEGYKNSGVALSVSGKMFCAGFSEKGKDDACAGDSGGPFVVAEGSGIHERWYLEGVVSWGSPIGCGNARQYGGYSKVSSFLEWIMQFI